MVYKYSIYSRFYKLLHHCGSHYCIFWEIPPDPSEEIFVVLIFAEQMHDAWATPLPVDGRTPHANPNPNDIAKKQACATTPYSSL